MLDFSSYMITYLVNKVFWFWTPGIAEVIWIVIGWLAYNGRDLGCPLVAWGAEGRSSAAHWLSVGLVGGAQFELESRRREKCQVSFGDSS